MLRLVLANHISCVRHGEGVSGRVGNGDEWIVYSLCLLSFRRKIEYRSSYQQRTGEPLQNGRGIYAVGCWAFCLLEFEVEINTSVSGLRIVPIALAIRNSNNETKLNTCEYRKPHIMKPSLFLFYPSMIPRWHNSIFLSLDKPFILHE